MKKLWMIMGISFLAFGVQAKQSSEHIEAIKQKIIQESINHYSGSCPCPYNTTRNGSRCGKRSAYHRVGGGMCPYVIQKM